MTIMYHYCSMQSFFGIIKSNSIWLNDVSKTNDVYEYSWILEIMEDILHEVDLADKFDKNYLKNSFIRFFQPHMACFSREVDSLSQWRGYADDGRGIAIGFNRRYFERNKDQVNKEIIVEDIIYDPVKQRQKVERLLMRELGRLARSGEPQGFFTLELEMLSHIIKYGQAFKHESFKEEKEIRIIHGYSDLLAEPDMFKYRVARDDLLSYIEFSLNVNNEDSITEIIIGPRCKATENEIRPFLMKNGFRNVSKIVIRQSECSYR